jgi:hypothetical protein
MIYGEDRLGNGRRDHDYQPAQGGIMKITLEGSAIEYGEVAMTLMDVVKTVYLRALPRVA